LSDFFYTQFIPNSSFEEIGGVEQRLVENAKIFYESHVGTNFELPSLELLEDVRKDYDSGAGLVLRCLVSRYIFDACKILTRDFGRQHHFKLHELVPYALDDAIDSNRVSRSAVKVYRTKDRPLAIKVLNSFNSESKEPKKNLKNWTVKLVPQYQEVNNFLLDHNLYFRSTWGILKDKGLRSIATSLNLSSFESALAQILIKYFQIVYKKSRIQDAVSNSEQRSSRSRCEAPKQENLQEMCAELRKPSSSDLLTILKEINGTTCQTITSEDCDRIFESLKEISSEILLDQLENIGDQLRKNSINRTTKIAAKSKDKSNVKLGIDSPYIEDFKKEIANSIGIVVDQEYQRLLKRRCGKPNAYLEVLHLYFCGKKKQEEIAVYLGVEQYKISRLLRKDNLYRDVCYSLIESRKSSVLPEIGKDIDKLNEVKNNLMKFINENTIMVDEAICQYVKTVKQEVG
jgi:hypothetical protein